MNGSGEDQGYAALGGEVDPPGSSSYQASEAPPRGPQTGSGPEAALRAPEAIPDRVAGREEGVATDVLIRDLLIFQVKLFLDGVKDIVLSPLSIAAVLWDLIPSRKGYRGRTFYQVLKIGERYDLWLNLYTPAREARTQGEGLLEAGVHSADSLVGKIEQLARNEAERQKRRSGSRETP